jgi:hypothetical protein
MPHVIQLCFVLHCQILNAIMKIMNREIVNVLNHIHGIQHLKNAINV